MGSTAIEPERMNSPLEIAKSACADCPGGNQPLCTEVVYNGAETAWLHMDGVRQELSAKADIAVSEPRIHSPWLGRRDCRITSAMGIIRGWSVAIPGSEFAMGIIRGWGAAIAG